MFEVESKKYDLKYTLGRIEAIERALKDSVMNIAASKNFMLSISELKAFVSYGLQEVGTDTHLPLKEGVDMAEKLISTNGYTAVVDWVQEALMRDCPFFFQGV